MAKNSKDKPKLEEWSKGEKLVLIRAWAMAGLTDEQIAKQIGISRRTFYEWRKKNKTLATAVKNSKEVADSVVEQSLYQKAANGDTTAQIFWLKNRKPKEWRRGRDGIHEEEVESLKLDNEIKRYKLDEMKRLSGELEPDEYKGIPADFIAPCFAKFHFDVQRIGTDGHLEYNLPGGRGSTKSSIISLEIIDLIEKNPTTHACVCRMVADTMRTSVFNQIAWAIEKLGLSKEYKATSNPLEFTKISTGQKIYFRGADDESKLKSIAVPFGSIQILWFEEFDQFRGTESVRKIEQSVIRGSDEAWIFKSFNPPKSKNNFANMYVLTPKENRMVVESCYTDVPDEWLGKPFLDEANYLKSINPDAYENEYLGVANGSGGNVFDNINPREITDEEMATFDDVINGVDWGWYPDPFAFNRMYYDPARSRLYIFAEYTANKKNNEETATILKNEFGLNEKDLVICDSAEPKSIQDYKRFGLSNARPAVKGPGSREYTFKWLAGLREIIIDPARCPDTLKEFLDYEYERNKEGEIIEGYPKGKDHHIDAIRYGTEVYSRPKATITADKVKERHFNTPFDQKGAQSFL